MSESNEEKKKIYVVGSSGYLSKETMNKLISTLKSDDKYEVIITDELPSDNKVLIRESNNDIFVRLNDRDTEWYHKFDKKNKRWR